MYVCIEFRVGGRGGLQLVGWLSLLLVGQAAAVVVNVNRSPYGLETS